MSIKAVGESGGEGEGAAEGRGVKFVKTEALREGVE
jgi:hypothetical protein